MKPHIKKRWPPSAALDDLKASLLAKLGPSADMDCEVDPQGYTLVEVNKPKPKPKHKPKKARKAVPWGEADMGSDGDDD